MPRAPQPRHHRDHGFTLIETSLAVVIIGVGVLALVEAHQAFMRANNWSTHTATGTYLANEVREMMRGLPKHDPVTGLYVDDGGALQGWGPETGELGVIDFDDVDDFDGVDSLGLLLTPNGTVALDDGDQAGPIDAFGTVIPEILSDGTVMLDGEGFPMALQGWSQEIAVEKVHPFDSSSTQLDGAELAAIPPDFGGVGIDGFPLRVTVTVWYQRAQDPAPTEVATVSWLVP